MHIFANPNQHSSHPATSRVQHRLAALLFPSRSPSPEPDSLPMTLLDNPSKTSRIIRDISDEGNGPTLQEMSPLPKLKPLPSPRQPSGGVSEISELFKSASLSQESLHDPFESHSNAIVSHPIHLRHLSADRLPFCEITPCFSLIPPSPPGHPYNTEAQLHSLKFPRGHQLSYRFVELYQLEDELGSGGYGFVMTARHRLLRNEVAVKFIIKEKVPEHAWMEDELLGRLPSEVVILNSITHENVVKFLDLFEDELYFYLVQELHGTPWQKCEENSYDSMSSTPSLSPSPSERSLDSSSEPTTPPFIASSCLLNPGICTITDPNLLKQACIRPTLKVSRPGICRRSSHDLFEYIEQSDDKRLSESQARHVFSQVVDAVHYLDSNGIAHRDIKDENLVIDRNLKVKLIDFGSACVEESKKPRPYHTQFFGTAAYASSEILLKKRYQAAPAEIWTLGVLLSYLLTGASPFPSVRAAAEGRVVLSEPPGVILSKEAVDLMRKCLDPNPLTRVKIDQVVLHPWLMS